MISSKDRMAGLLGNAGGVGIVALGVLVTIESVVVCVRSEPALQETTEKSRPAIRVTGPSDLNHPIIPPLPPRR
jgi:hypothetical protein